MSSNSEISQVYPSEKHANKLSEIRFSRRRQQTTYGSSVNRINKNDNNSVNFNSVFCYGDGPNTELKGAKTNQRVRLYTDGKDTNLRTSQKNKYESAGQQPKSEANTDGKQDKRYKLLEWLKSSQAKRDENNRQVFSRWIEKMDNVHPKATGQPAFYCDYLPHPHDLYTAVNNHPDGAIGTPTVYVGISPFVFPTQAPNNYEGETPASTYAAATEKYPPGLMDSCPPEMEFYFPHEMHCPISQGNCMFPVTEPNENMQSLDDQTSTLETASTEDKIGFDKPAFYPQMLSPAFINYSNAPMMIPLSYMPYMPCEQDSITSQNQSESLADVGEQSHRKVYANVQNPCMIGGQAGSWAPLVESSEPYISYSPNSPPPVAQHLPSKSYPPQYNRYFYHPTYPMMANPGCNNIVYNRANQQISSPLNFNIPQWTSLLEDISKEPSNKGFENCNLKVPGLGQPDSLNRDFVPCADI